jgi:LPXTG-site transpeptidase (sortase) family protein
VSFRTLASSLVAVIALGLAFASPGASAHGTPHIVIPRIHLNVPLSSYLDGGPIVYYRDADTLAIAGHRTTWSHPFNQLPQLHRGDTIRVGVHVYRYVRATTVRPWQTWILNYKGLVLSTCYPAGSDAYRYVVFAKQIS